jgi:ATP-binding cassette subfamily B protein
VQGDVVFNNVNFVYPHTGIHALRNFTLTIKEGEKILILGKTGAGKSTIAQLLLRFYTPTSGNITIGGRDLAAYSLRSLRQQISYVPQDVFLFSDTVANNISFGLSSNYNESEVSKAAEYASVHGEIEHFAKGYQTMVGERGVTLSGGQKQRLSIARALIKKPNMVIFDDCLSAVDTATENKIIGNLQHFLKDKTAIVITHRIFTSFNFDRIVVLENGTIIENGKHESLLSQNGYYAQLHRLQSVNKDQELANDHRKYIVEIEPNGEANN